MVFRTYAVRMIMGGSGNTVAFLASKEEITWAEPLVRGRQITSWPSVATDYRNAGAERVDEKLVVCANRPFPLISSRKPDDLPCTVPKP